MYQSEWGRKFIKPSLKLKHLCKSTNEARVLWYNQYTNCRPPTRFGSSDFFSHLVTGRKTKQTLWTKLEIYRSWMHNNVRPCGVWTLLWIQILLRFFFFFDTPTPKILQHRQRCPLSLLTNAWVPRSVPHPFLHSSSAPKLPAVLRPPPHLSLISLATLHPKSHSAASCSELSLLQKSLKWDSFVICIDSPTRHALQRLCR